MEIKALSKITTTPGIQRDGTLLDGSSYSDGQWCRFQRGKPKKIGGYRRITNTLFGPVRENLVWSRANTNALYSFSSAGIQMVLVDANGLGASIIDRTPAGFVPNSDYNWTTDVLFNAGGAGTAVLACATKTLSSIDDTTPFSIFYGDAATNGAFVAIAGVGPGGTGVSGGVFATAPYAVYYGTDGYVQWSDANQPTVLTTGDAGSFRATGSKIVKGLPLRSGSGIAALLWSLDSVIRMEYIGGNAVFKFTHLTSQSSIMSSRSVIEYDNKYYWVGIDRFLVTNGGSVEELPNQMNLNWFFDNLNEVQRQKVWAMKIPRYGEIWWFYPRGSATECTHAVIYNVREGTWYDTQLARTAGFYAQVFTHPIMSSSIPDPDSFLIAVSGVVGTVAVGDILQGTTSGSRVSVTFVAGTSYTVFRLNGTTPVAAENFTATPSGATGTVATVTQLYELYLHELRNDYDMTRGENVTAIESYFETHNFGYPVGAMQPDAPQGLNRWMRFTRMEPDFLCSGSLSLIISGPEYAQGPDVESAQYSFTGSTPVVDLREQRRNMRLKITSNEVGGYYEMGDPLLHLEPGDARS